MYRECGGDLTLYLDPNAEQNYLKLEQLGSVLALLSDQLPGECVMAEFFTVTVLFLSV